MKKRHLELLKNCAGGIFLLTLLIFNLNSLSMNKI